MTNGREWINLEWEIRWNCQHLNWIQQSIFKTWIYWKGGKGCFKWENFGDQILIYGKGRNSLMKFWRSA